MPDEAERRQRKARRDFEIIAEQGSDIEDWRTTSPALARSEGLADNIQRLLQQLEGNSDASCSESGSGSSSGQAVDQKPKVPPTEDEKPKIVPPVDPKPEPSSP
ncbi:uncharacterized protein LOC133892414 [Phragmites australis]|uniref:uncharacterized protein LOC133892414 n=1 Tax=Phragmites australis TaxID=29695 RepID=UPI002D792BBB|nr:uncharacterized protein LOC133892414 [Phragmites australis]